MKLKHCSPRPRLKSKCNQPRIIPSWKTIWTESRIWLLMSRVGRHRLYPMQAWDSICLACWISVSTALALTWRHCSAQQRRTHHPSATSVAKPCIKLQRRAVNQRFWPTVRPRVLIFPLLQIHMTWKLINSVSHMNAVWPTQTQKWIKPFAMPRVFCNAHVWWLHNRRIHMTCVAV